MQGRSWCFTLNNYTTDEWEHITTIECQYIVVGREKGASGTPHLQGYVHFEKNKRLGALKKLEPRAHWELAKGDAEQNYNYCTKEDLEPFVKGERPITRRESAAAGGAAIKRKYEEAYALAKKGKLEEIPKDLLTRHYGAYKSIAKDNMEPLEPVSELQHEWYYGASGTGKSRKAYEENPGAYRKSCNKWWDGYKDEDVVIIDDFDKRHEPLVHHLKIWGDHYPFIAEMKGGAKMIRPKKIIITSNYKPEDIWYLDPSSRDPIERRFKLVNF